VISNHRVKNNHVMNWGEVKIIDKERLYTKRIISEMIHIKKQTRGLNSKAILICFQRHYYFPLIESLAHI